MKLIYLLEQLFDIIKFNTFNKELEVKVYKFTNKFELFKLLKEIEEVKGILNKRTKEIYFWNESVFHEGILDKLFNKNKKDFIKFYLWRNKENKKLEFNHYGGLTTKLKNHIKNVLENNIIFSDA